MVTPSLLESTASAPDVIQPGLCVKAVGNGFVTRAIMVALKPANISLCDFPSSALHTGLQLGSYH